jgi:hypothetical protein
VDLGQLPCTPWVSLFRRPSTYWVLLLTLGFWGMAVAGRVLWNGSVFGLDYSLWFPDGTFYAYRAFVWSGYSPEDATAALNSMYVPLGTEIAPGLPEKPPIYDSRILYSALSVPFVWALGSMGLLVIPALGLLLGVLLPVLMLLRRNLALAAAVLGALALTSTTAARWSVANLTDGVVLGLFAIVVVLLPWNGVRPSGARVAVLALLAIAVGLTRQALPVMVLVVVVPWITQGLLARRWRTPWLAATLAVAIPSIVVTVVTLPRDAFWLVPISQDAGGLSGITTQDRILQVPLELVRMTFIELGQLGILDRGLLLLLLVSAAGALLAWRSSLASAWLGTALGCIFTTAWVGAAGVNFRYSLAMIPVSILVSAALWARFRADQPPAVAPIDSERRTA